MIPRFLTEKMRALLRAFPIVALTGPRQSGKTTLVKELLGEEYRYLSLEDIDTRAFAEEDPRGFLQEYPSKVVFDEVQRVPALFSYMQGVVDKSGMMGQFILTGSHHFLLLEKITQSLAGRVGMLHLLPLSLEELEAPPKLESILYRGMYPALYQRKVEPYQWHSNYLQTYVERDLRLIKNVHDLGSFQHFMRMCAARCGQLLDLTSIANDCGLSHNTIKSWIHLLEASFILFQLRPHHKNFNKRLVKSPKIYFYDTGLLCHLLRIEKESELLSHHLRGAIFESFAIGELMKAAFNRARIPSLYFWRDKQGREVDCIIEKSDRLIPIEIKSAKTLSSAFFSSLGEWKALAGPEGGEAYLIYGGERSEKRSIAEVVPWKKIPHIATGR